MPELHALTDDDFLRMAAVAFDTKNALTRMGVKRDESIRQIAAAMHAELNERMEATNG